MAGEGLDRRVEVAGDVEADASVLDRSRDARQRAQLLEVDRLGELEVTRR